MSYLMVDMFDDTVPITSTFTIQHKGIKLDSLRTHAYMAGTVTGSFTLTLSQSGIDLGSVVLTAAEINSARTGTFAHGMMTWKFTKPLFLGVNEELDEQEYEVRFESTGFVSGDDLNTFGICKDFDNVLVSEYGVNYNDTTNEQRACSRPYGLEIYKWDI